MSNQLQNAKAELKRGISKKDPNKSFYIFEIQLYDPEEKDYFTFKVDFLTENEARLVRKCGYPLVQLEKKVVDDSKKDNLD